MPCQCNEQLYRIICSKFCVRHSPYWMLYLHPTEQANSLFSLAVSDHTVSLEAKCDANFPTSEVDARFVFRNESLSPFDCMVNGTNCTSNTDYSSECADFNDISSSCEIFNTTLYAFLTTPAYIPYWTYQYSLNATGIYGNIIQSWSRFNLAILSFFFNYRLPS